jgi:P27 family predicted phage terminase small subunit
MGRNPKPIHLHLLSGNKNNLTKSEINKRKELEDKVSFKKDNLKPPTWLNKEAKKIFSKIVKEFEHNELLVNVDVHALSLFCDAYVDYINCSKIIEEEGLLVEYTNKAAETNKVPHPLLTKKKQLFDQMNKLSGEFGFSPIARARLSMPKETPKQKTKEEDMFGEV